MKISYPSAAKNVTEAIEAVVAAAQLPTEVNLAQLPGYKVTTRPVVVRVPAKDWWGRFLGRTQEVKTGTEWVHSWADGARQRTHITAAPSAVIPTSSSWYIEVRGVEVWATSYEPYQRQLVGYLIQPVARIEDVCPQAWMPNPCDQGSGCYDGQLVFLDELAAALEEGMAKIQERAVETATK